MALIAPSPAGGAVTYVAASASDTYANSGIEKAHVKNGSVAPITVTAVAASALGCPAGLTHNTAFTVGAGADKLLPALSPERYGPVVTLTFSDPTTVTVGIIG